MRKGHGGQLPELEYVCALTPTAAFAAAESTAFGGKCKCGFFPEETSSFSQVITENRERPVL
jgi:hypothetical protein